MRVSITVLTGHHYS